MGLIANKMLLEWLNEHLRRKEKKDAQTDASSSSYDPSCQKPVLHKSICSGETTAGFKDLKTGKYTDVALIRNDADLKQFMKEYGITEVPETEY